MVEWHEFIYEGEVYYVHMFRNVGLRVQDASRKFVGGDLLKAIKEAWKSGTSYKDIFDKAKDFLKPKRYYRYHRSYVWWNKRGGVYRTYEVKFVGYSTKDDKELRSFMENQLEPIYSDVWDEMLQSYGMVQYGIMIETFGEAGSYTEVEEIDKNEIDPEIGLDRFSIDVISAPIGGVVDWQRNETGGEFK